MGFIPAKNEAEWRELMINCPTGLITTMDDWDAYIRDIDREHPLAGVDSETVEDFTKNLIFRNGGLAGAKYMSIARKMTYIQFTQLWARFGMDMMLFESHKEYECKGPGTCAYRSAYICTANC